MLSINESAGASVAARAPTLDLHEIQATVLRPRPAPYFGSHVLLRVDDAQAGRAFLRRLTPHVDSAAGWWNAADPWLAVGISYADSKLTRLTDVKLHRLIRRGTTYGPPYDGNALSEADDEIPRGAYFLFISAKAMATIEFLQQEWINDGNFIGIGDERDPIIGTRRGRDLHHSERSRQATRARHRNIQCAAWR
jgi:deferrochelatase/peroxidase EfeB